MATSQVALDKLIEVLEIGSDSTSAYYCISRNAFIMIDDEARHWAEDGLDVRDAPQWMKVQIDQVKAIEEDFNKDYYRLPNKFEIDEKDMMRRFAHRISNVATSRDVMQSIKGRDGYRKFRKVITDHDLLDQWYGFRKQCFKEMAISWCQRHGLDYSDR